MEKSYPQKLKKGDVVRVIAPAQSMGIISNETKITAEQRFRELGLKLQFGEHINETNDFCSSSVESRVADLHAAFLDPEVKAVLVVIGGFNSNQLLDYIDYDLIQSHSKIFCGYSDITALNNAIYAKTGLVNYSGPAFSTLGKMKDVEYTFDYFKKCFFSDAVVEIKPSEKWDDRKWWRDQTDSTFFSNPGWQIIQEGAAEGTTIGGNLCTLNLLQGTEYMPPLKDSILFVEDDYESKAGNFDRDLQSLIHQPEFSQVKGIVIGRFQVASEVTTSLIEQIVTSKKELKGIPIIAGVDFGHTSPMITFPVGGEVRINASKTNPSITITKH